MYKTIRIAIIPLLVLFSSNSFADRDHYWSDRELAGTATGAVLGAAGGALLGYQVADTTGAWVGGTAGAVAGGVLGHELTDDRDRYYDGRQRSRYYRVSQDYSESRGRGHAYGHRPKDNHHRYR